MIYDPLELGQPGNPECPDKYNEESTRLTPKSTRVILQISKAAVKVQFGTMPHGRSLSVGAVQWQAEEPYLPMIAALSRNYDAVRVRNLTPGEPAQVFLTFL